MPMYMRVFRGAESTPIREEILCIDYGANFVIISFGRRFQFPRDDFCRLELNTKIKK